MYVALLGSAHLSIPWWSRSTLLQIKMDSKLVPVSITWNWTVIGEFDTSVLNPGTTYEVQLPLSLNRSIRDGWTNPLTLDLEVPQGVKPPPNTVYPQSIPVNGAFQNFSFPSFTAQGSGKIRLTASTTQNANLPSALIIANAQAKIKGTTFTIPLTISWAWSASGSVKAAELDPGSSYQVELPLTLQGDTYDGWRNPLTLQLQLPGSAQNQVSPATVYPQSISLNGTYKDFPYTKFVAQGGPDTINFSATTTQAANLPSSLLISNQKAKIKEVSP